MQLEQDAASDWCLQHGGEMGARMRALDWSRTPLGPPAQWPQQLKLAVALCLRSRFPIAIFWGPQYALLYNDAYIPVLGAAKHPAWMGMSGCDCWHEVWPTVGPIMQGVRARDCANGLQYLAAFKQVVTRKKEGFCRAATR